MGNLSAVVAIAAVAFSFPFSTPAADPGRIYVYAQRETAARSWLRITCSGIVVAELKQGMLFAINVPRGRHTLAVETGVPTIIDVRSGEDAFVRLDWNYAVGRPPIPVLSVVQPDQARKEMRWLSYIHPKQVLSSSVPKADPRDPMPLELKRRPEK
jgi:hypothetical protein